MKKFDLGPLKNGQTVAIIGGGPAGASCAITLKNHAKEKNLHLNVIVYESKHFEGGVDHNECSGVLSQPIERIIEDGLKIPFPWHLVKRVVPGYYLHTGGHSIKLDGNGEVSYAVRRIQFDAYLLQKAKECGATVIRCRAHGVEISKDEVIVYSKMRHLRADVVVGAFGLEEGTHTIFEKESPYKSPNYLLSIVTKFHPKGRHHNLEQTDGYIHAFLPELEEIEFGAITPKADHYTINIAGERITARTMDAFLQLPEVLRALPENFRDSHTGLDYHRGCFPITPAKNFVGDRYVAVGDAAGLIRPFKGKGVNSACLMGIKAAETILNDGISKEAFQTYRQGFRTITRDIPYAKAARRFVVWGAHYGFLAPVFRTADTDPILKEALFDSISGKKMYREILRDTMSIPRYARITAIIVRWLAKRIFASCRFFPFTSSP